MIFLSAGDRAWKTIYGGLVSAAQELAASARTYASARAGPFKLL